MDPLGPEAFRAVWSGLNHPEDIVWDGDRRVLYAGGEAGEIYRGDLGGEFVQVAACGEGSFVLGLALDGGGNLYVCERGNARLLCLDPVDFDQRVISRGTADRPMACPNYPAFDSDGVLYVSDSGSWGSDDGVIYRISPSTGTTVWATRPSDFTNGLALALDGRSLYVAESRACRVWQIEFGEDGEAGDPRCVWHEPGTVPDGLAVDVDGMVYIGCYTPDSVYVLDPSTGASELFAHDWSGQGLQAPTNLAFVGDDLDQLASANLCGWTVNVTASVPRPGHPLPRPTIEAWYLDADGAR